MGKIADRGPWPTADEYVGIGPSRTEILTRRHELCADVTRAFARLHEIDPEGAAELVQQLRIVVGDNPSSRQRAQRRPMQDIERQIIDTFHQVGNEPMTRPELAEASGLTIQQIDRILYVRKTGLLQRTGERRDGKLLFTVSDRKGNSDER